MKDDGILDAPIGHWPGRGRSTLVLGAGVSASRGVPSWKDLVDGLCREIEHVGGDLQGGFSHPFAEQVRLEMLHRWLVDNGSGCSFLAEDLVRWWRDQNPPRELKLPGGFDADDVFRELMRRALYRNVKQGGADTLGAISELITRQADMTESDRRILRIISFNADDLIERSVNTGETIRVCPIMSPDTPPVRYSGAIPIYHVHGFLPASHLSVPRPVPAVRKNWKKKARRPQGISDDGDLVFRDSEYWASVANPLALPNRVMVNALHDSRCLFFGLSMTDVNLWRWIGTRSGEIQQTARARVERRSRDFGWPTDQMVWSEIVDAHSHEQHFWIRAGQDENGDRVSAFLYRQRGIRTVRLDTWSYDSVCDVLADLFP